MSNTLSIFSMNSAIFNAELSSCLKFTYVQSPVATLWLNIWAARLTFIFLKGFKQKWTSVSFGHSILEDSSASQVRTFSGWCQRMQFHLSSQSHGSECCFLVFLIKCGMSYITWTFFPLLDWNHSSSTVAPNGGMLPDHKQVQQTISQCHLAMILLSVTLILECFFSQNVNQRNDLGVAYNMWIYTAPYIAVLVLLLMLACWYLRIHPNSQNHLFYLHIEADLED